jgi:hypothetical protein
MDVFVNSLGRFAAATDHLAGELADWHASQANSAPPHSTTASYFLGMLDERRGRLDDAIRWYEWASRLSSLDPHPLAASRRDNLIRISRPRMPS